MSCGKEFSNYNSREKIVLNEFGFMLRFFSSQTQSIQIQIYISKIKKKCYRYQTYLEGFSRSFIILDRF